MFIHLPEKKQEEVFKALVNLINYHSLENGSNTPDWILANYLLECLKSYESAILDVKEWNYEGPDPGEVDGDAQSALASAGMGTDEDYGGTDERI